MANIYVTIKINSLDLQKFIEYYKSYQKANSGEYISFFAQYQNISITVYHSTKHPDQYKVVFIGNDAEKEAKKWSSMLEISGERNNKQRQKSLHFLTYDRQYGSDEVGFGDFFGPLVVVACYLDNRSYQALNDFIVTDSKRLSDDYILKTAPLLLERVPHKVNIVDNQKFNQLTKQGYNMNKIKAMLHLNVLGRLKELQAKDAPSYIDKFCSEKKFSEYTKGMKAISPLIMEEKGESLFPSVALASMFARYYFLVEIDKLNRKFKTQIPLGASSRVDQFADEFLKKHGQTALDKIVKQNFSNYQKLFT